MNTVFCPSTTGYRSLNSRWDKPAHGEQRKNLLSFCHVPENGEGRTEAVNAHLYLTQMALNGLSDLFQPFLNQFVFEYVPIW